MRSLIISEADSSKDKVHHYLGKMVEFKDVRTAKNTDQAVQDLKKYKFDLVILDLGYPSDANLRLLKWIRSTNINIGVIFLSSENKASYVREVFGYGVCDYIIKPFSYKRFREAVVRAIGRRAYLSEFKYMNQDEIDHFIALNVFKTVELIDSKGISTETLKRIKKVISEIKEGFTARQIADNLGLSRITVRRYLEHMVENGILHTDLVYGEIGRPQKVYKVIRRG